jgi:hypothetical protein
MATEYINVEPDWVRMFDYCIYQAQCDKNETIVQMLEYGKRLHLASVARSDHKSRLPTSRADILAVENIKLGEFVKIRRGSGWTEKVYKRAKFCRINQAYQLDDQSDISKARYVKKGTELLINFTY